MSTGAAGRRTVVVTGATGLLGRPLCARLLARGWEVRALGRDPAAVAAALPGARAGRCDLPETIDEALLGGADALVHAAYATRETNEARAREVNEDGTRRLLEASRRAGIPRFVFVSSIAADPAAPNYYARSKHALEGLLDPRRDLVVRPGQILAPEGRGRFQEMRDAICRTRVVPVFGGGRQPLQTVHVDDLCEAMARALERDVTGALNIAESEPLSLGAFMRRIAERARVRAFFVPLPFGPTLAALRVIEALHLPFPLRVESLLAVRGMKRVPVTADLARLGMTARSAEESLAQLM